MIERTMDLGLNCVIYENGKKAYKIKGYSTLTNIETGEEFSASDWRIVYKEEYFVIEGRESTPSCPNEYKLKYVIVVHI